MQALGSRLVQPANTSFGPAVVWKLNTSHMSWEGLVQGLVKERRLSALEPGSEEKLQ